MHQALNGVPATADGMLTATFSISGLRQILSHYSKSVEVQIPATDVASELINCIYGAIKTNLNARGHSFDMALPVLVADKTHDPKAFLNKTGCLTVPFTSAAGDFFVSVQPG